MVGADRKQGLLCPTEIDALIGADHPARVVWGFVEALDLSALYAKVGSVEGHQGRPAIDPKVLLALWLFATSEGVGSARALAQLCREHDAYRWICGGLQPCHKTLSDFRVKHPEVLDALLTDSVAALILSGVVSLERLAQDGLRVRASAGASSFRRRKKLLQALRQAKEVLEALTKEIDDDSDATNRRRRAARERAARERVDRVQRALDQWKRIAKCKRTDPEETARASMTDPDSRVMRLPAGEYRPGYNGQLATDTGSGIVVGVDVTNSGGDMGQMTPMLEQVRRRYGRGPREHLVDGGYAARDEIDCAERSGCRVLAPVFTPWDRSRDPHAPRPKDSPHVAAWRVRMKSGEAKETYKLRAAVAEWVNAGARMRGLRQVLVRGLPKVRTVFVWHALAHNLRRMVGLGLLAPSC